MKVMLLNYEFPPAGGGAGFATMNIGRQLVKQGIEVHVLTAQIESETDGDILDGMRVFRVTSWRKGVHDCGLLGAWSWVAFALRKRFQLQKQYNYDLEHYFFGLPTGVLALTATGRNRVPYVVSLRGSDVPGYDPFNQRLEKIHTLLRPVTRRIWSRAGRVVALSTDLRSIALRTSPELGIDVIPNGIETESFSPVDQENQHPDCDRPMTIVTVSRLLERKGIHHLLEAVAKPDPLNVRLVIAGTGSYEPNLRALAVELVLSDRVEFRGFVRRDQLPEVPPSLLCRGSSGSVSCLRNCPRARGHCQVDVDRALT